MKMVRVAVIGAGHLGGYHCDKVFKIPQAQLVAIVDPDQSKAQKLAEKYESKALGDYHELDADIDAVIIATPTPLHFSIAKHFIGKKKHLLIEKPITVSVQECEELCRMAETEGVLLQVGHVERFNPALRSAQKELKKPLFIECHRLAPFKPRSTDVDVVLDLMIHDIDVIMSLVDSPVESVSAVGTPVITSHVDIANARIEFASKAVANITASRVSQTATRKFRVFQESQYLSIDFGTGEVNLTTKVSDNWENLEDQLPLEFQAWELEKADALLMQDQAFIDCVLKNEKPLVSGREALSAMKVAEQIRYEIGRRLELR